jgi:hypothetical protein
MYFPSISPKITYTSNPLNSVIELDQNQKREFYQLVKNYELKDIIYAIRYRLKEKIPDTDDIIRLCKLSKSDEYVNQLYESLLDSLDDGHYGDCICVCCSCTKCMAEELLGINTIAGLEPHSANWISCSFSNGETLDEAIEYLKEPLTRKQDIKQSDYDRWSKERVDALHWLIEYRKGKYLKEE